MHTLPMESAFGLQKKVPDREIVEAAAEDGLPVLVTEYTLFEACGILYGAGIRGCSKRGK